MFNLTITVTNLGFPFLNLIFFNFMLKKSKVEVNTVMDLQGCVCGGGGGGVFGKAIVKQK